ncbi:Isoflavone reductase like [Glycine soja]|uniref:Isoflavone reductase like n=1 Tax=Glycine soja TaxID=3848 RepID=A0A0B2NXQ7_GLYSO|nr:Isoflavone reductase like [Glycine soja]
MVEMWEIKIGKKLETLHVFEGELLQKIKGTSFPANFEMVFIYSAFIKGDHTYFDIESSFGVNGTQLYPHLKYTTDWICFQFVGLG